MRRPLVLTMVAVFVVALLAAACRSDSGPSAGSDASANISRNAVCVSVGERASAAASVAVTLNEWAIGPATSSVTAGTVTFDARNRGDEAHELVVIKGVTPNQLPKGDGGALDEKRLPAGAIVGEIEPFGGGRDCDGTFALAAGEYTLVCNITQELNGKSVSHLAEGMVTTFTVNPRP